MSHIGITLEHAQKLAIALHEKHWKTYAPNWKVADTLQGIILQIDNMTAGLVRPDGAPTTHEEAARPFRSGETAADQRVVVAAPAGACGGESPGVISLSDVRERSSPSHILCIGWETIRRLSMEGAIWDTEHGAGIVAADDLFLFDFTEYRYGPPAKRRKPAQEGA